MSRVWILFFCWTIGFAGCYGRHDSGLPQVIQTVQVANVEVRDVQPYIYPRGITASSDSVDIVARVEGYLQQVLFEESDIVEKGAPLYLIEQDEYSAKLNAAVAQLQSAKANEQLQANDLARAKQLFDPTKNVRDISEEEYQTTLANWQSAVASVKSAESQVSLANLNLTYTHIVSPLSGMIGRNIFSVGNLVGEGGEKTVLARIEKMDPILVYIDLPDVDFNMMLDAIEEQTADKKDVTVNDNASPLVNVVYQAEQPATPPAEQPTTSIATSVESSNLPVIKPSENSRQITLLAKNRSATAERMTFEIALPGNEIGGERNYAYSGKITFVDNTIATGVGKITIRGSIPNPEYRIFPGQNCFVRIPLKLIKDAVVIEEQAVMTFMNEHFVYVVNEKNVVEKRMVITGRPADKKSRVITSGLKAGEKYVVVGTQKVKTGHEVKVVPFKR